MSLNEQSQVFIIGAGVMGVSTALDFASRGMSVRVKDVDANVLLRAPEVLRQNYRAARMMCQHFRSLSGQAIAKRIHFQTDDVGLSAADLIIENIGENRAQKIAEYQRIASICSPKAIIALNTSCISITSLAASLPDPRRVIGMHLMNPVPMKAMVEVIRGDKTSQETEDCLVAFLKMLHKNPVVINDRAGFVSNRLSHLLMNEAASVVSDGVATVEQVDRIIKQGFGHKMGPLETADLIGLDTVVNSLDVLYDSYQEEKYQCCDLLRAKVAAGNYGRKSGEGFYHYQVDSDDE